MPDSERNNILYIGEVSRLLDIPRDTLRFFEKRGIVVPKKDPHNNYRYYNDWDIHFLIEYKRYRGYEFNLEEARDILHRDSLAGLEDLTFICPKTTW